jgi:hypothetical protein
MLKVARKTSTDPVQEKLRQNKALWNKEVSTFINDLINFKKTMNGAPSKFHPEKGSIKDPIPADPTTIIGVLANDFQEIAQKGNALIKEQIEYAKTRRKSVPKPISAPVLPVPAGTANDNATPAVPDLTKQLATFEQKYSLVSEGSNKVTRFFTRLFNPTIGFGDAAALRRARMAMLNACADTYKDLGKFQVEIVRSSKESISQSNKKLHDAWSKWTLVSRAYSIYKSSKSVSAPDKGGTIENMVSEQDAKEEKTLEKLDQSVKQFEDTYDTMEEAEHNAIPNETAQDEIVAPQEPVVDLSALQNLEIASNIAKDYKNNLQNIPPNNSGDSLKELDTVINQFIASRGKKIDPSLKDYYAKSIMNLNSEFGTNGASFKDIVLQLKAKVKAQLKSPVAAPVITPVQDKSASVLIEKVAQNFLRKWVGKTMHQLSLFDKTSSYRLNCYNLASELRSKLNEIMDLLEAGLDESKLDPLIIETNTKIVSLRGMMRSLHMSEPVINPKKGK